MDNLARAVEVPKRWGGNVNSIRHTVDLLESRGYTANDFFWTADGRYYLYVDKLAAPIWSDSLEIVRLVVEDLPLAFEERDICKYRSIAYGGELEVEFVRHNDVGDWPIKTAQVRFGTGRVDSVRVAQLRATGRSATREKPRPLIFGVR